MTTQRALGLYRLAFSLLGFAALATILSSSLRRATFNPVNFFSFFTIESNLLAAVVLLLTGFAALRGTERFALLRGAVTLYMTMTGIIYFLLLRGLEASLQLPIPWVNAVLHYVMPLAVLLDWLLTPPEDGFGFRQALVWLVFPALYVVYSLARGALTGWYPYPFLNAAARGYVPVVLTCALMIVGVIILSGLLAARARGPLSR